MGTLVRDVRFALKLLWKDPVFAAAAILTLAVCTGANTAVFTIVHSVLLKPLPVPEADRLMLMSNQYPRAGVGEGVNSGVPDYFDRLREVTAFEEQGLFNYASQTVDVDGRPERVTALAVTPSLLRLLRVPPALGRPFADADGQLGQEQKVLLSHGLWERLYAGDPGAVGRDLQLGGRPFTVVGVMPRDFLFLDPEVRLWIPLAFTDEQRSDATRHSNNFFNVGRLAPHATRELAQAQVDALNAANLLRFPQHRELLTNAGFHTRVEPLQEMLVRDVRGSLYLLWGGAAFVLLIGVVNIANLLLARMRVRLKELATRVALGASGRRVAGQLLTESAIVALAGGALGLLLGSWSLEALAGVGIDQLPRAGEVRMGATVVVVSLAVSLGAGVLIGLVPLRFLSRTDLGQALREEGRGGASPRGLRTVRRALVVGQVAFAFVLLIGAGLLLESFRRLLAVDPGFAADGVLTASMTAPRARDSAADRRERMARALPAIRGIPGVVAAGATSTVPFGGSYNDSVILAEGYRMQPGESLVSPQLLVVTAGYFGAMGIGLVRGRDFQAADDESAPPVVIVDERLARKFWPDRDPIGRRMYQPTDAQDVLRVDDRTRWLTVVGVVRSVRLRDLEGRGNTAGAYYFPYAQQPTRTITFAIRARGRPDAVIRALRAELARVDPEAALFDARTMAERRERSLLPRKASLVLSLAFGGVALFLSALGIYGVLAYLVSQRRREIGIRVAMGGSAGDMYRLVLTEGLLLVGLGLAVGLAGTVLLRRALESQVYGVGPLDPSVIGAAVFVLGLVAAAACALPARSAARVDPAAVLSQP
jgi:predicted permease